MDDTKEIRIHTKKLGNLSTTEQDPKYGLIKKPEPTKDMLYTEAFLFLGEGGGRSCFVCKTICMAWLINSLQAIVFFSTFYSFNYLFRSTNWQMPTNPDCIDIFFRTLRPKARIWHSHRFLRGKMTASRLRKRDRLG